MKKNVGKYLSTIIGLIFFVFPPGLSQAAKRYGSDYFAGLKARSIGPAGMSGRIAAVDVVLSDPRIIYVGTATGGIWKSVDGGVTWKPIFDSEPTSSIGDVTIDQQRPEVIWVGTGEANPRNSAGVGRGVFKSLDGGETWQFLGLEKTERISRVLLDPTRTETAFVAAMGTTWGENPERGIFKTEDGGKTWRKVLYVDEKTGAADLAIDPRNPNRLLAAMWEHRRWPWFFNSGGPSSGLYLSTDGGETWKKITEKDGLPKGNLGRIGISFSRSNPEIVYALVEAERSALCRSEDGGRTWKIVNDSPGVSPRPFYYSDIRVHPAKENTVYRLGGNLDISIDGGKSFKPLMSFFAVHGDFHELWIHPEDGERMIVGGDGGIAFTFNGGKSWDFVQNLPLGQYYHVSVDLERPYNIYGGLQDNGSWRGPSWVLNGPAIFNFHWQPVGFGDGFGTLAHPKDTKLGYCMSQGGYLMRFNTETGEQKDIRPPSPEGVELRFNWNAAIAVDPFDPHILYYGSQFLHKSTDEGRTWKIISPDLTSNDPEKQKQAESGGLTRDVTHAENHCTILTIAPSPLKRGMIWVGTDDGKVQLTQDDGATWKDLSPKILGKKGSAPPPGTWIPCIEASHHDPGTAYVAFDDHRRSNWKPYLFMTEDYGETWTSLVTPEIDGFIHVIREDPGERNLLFLGTEFGLFVSLDRGKSWMKWTHGFPTVPVNDIVIHPRDHDLVVGTHGRSLYILDDITPLRELKEEIKNRKLHLFKVNDVYQFRTGWMTMGYLAPGDAEFQGENRKYGALITYSLSEEALKKTSENEAQKESIKIEIFDSEGKLVRTLKGEKKYGMNRINWDLRHEPFKTLFDPFEGFFPQIGPLVLPGKYKVRIQLENESVEQSFEVHPDPRYPLPEKERKEKYELIMKNGKYIEAITEAYKKIEKSLESLETLLKRIDEGEEMKREGIEKKCQTMKERLKEIANRLSPPRDRSGIFKETEVQSLLLSLDSRLQSALDSPTEGQLQEFKRLEEIVKKEISFLNEFFEKDYEPFAEEVERAGYSILHRGKPINL